MLHKCDETRRRRSVNRMWRQMFLEILQPHDSLFTNVTLVKAADVFVKPLVLTKPLVRLELCVTLRTVEKLSDERMRVGHVTCEVILPLERRRAERADVAACVAVTRQKMFSQKFLLQKWFFAVRAFEKFLDLQLGMCGHQVVTVTALGERCTVAKL